MSLMNQNKKSIFEVHVDEEKRRNQSSSNTKDLFELCKPKRRYKYVDFKPQGRSKNEGRWTDKEHSIFIEKVLTQGNNWKKVNFP